MGASTSWQRDYSYPRTMGFQKPMALRNRATSDIASLGNKLGRINLVFVLFSIWKPIVFSILFVDFETTSLSVLRLDSMTLRVPCVCWRSSICRSVLRTNNDYSHQWCGKFFILYLEFSLEPFQLFSTVRLSRFSVDAWLARSSPAWFRCCEQKFKEERFEKNYCASR